MVPAPKRVTTTRRDLSSKHAWAKLKDEQLLDQRICDLNLESRRHAA